jgi:hypothetical protein
MATGELALHMIARHGYAIERLKREMAADADGDYLVESLAYDAANFVYAFLIASGNRVSLADRTLRDELYEALLSVFAEHGISNRTFVVWPDVRPGGAAGCG